MHFGPTVERRIHEGASVTVQANGTGVATIGPPQPFAYWELDDIRVSVPGGIGNVELLHGPVGSPITLDTTHRASDNRSSPPRCTLYPGDVLTALFTNCTPAVVATVTVRGFQRRYP